MIKKNDASGALAHPQAETGAGAKSAAAGPEVELVLRREFVQGVSRQQLLKIPAYLFSPEALDGSLQRASRGLMPLF